MTGAPRIDAQTSPLATPAAGQTRSASALEALLGTGVGFVLSLLLQRMLFPALGHRFSLDQNMLISLAFTLLSVARSYLVRRLFNRIARDGCGPGNQETR